MRLIDADELKKLYEPYKGLRLKVPCEVICLNIEDQPTIQPQGIDKDRLIEELEKLKDNKLMDIRAYSVMSHTLDLVKDIVNQQPTGKDTNVSSNGWIPVSSGELPKEEEDVLIQWGQYNDMSTARIRDGEWYVHGIFLQKIGNPQIITAWQPLPQPYKESE